MDSASQDATQRALQEQVTRRAQQQTTQALDALRDTYAKESSQQAERQAKVLEHQKLKDYQQLMSLKSQQNRALSQNQLALDRTLSQQADRWGEAMTDLKLNYAREKSETENRERQELSDLHQNHDSRKKLFTESQTTGLQQETERYDQTLKALVDQREQETEKLTAANQDVLTRLNDHFQNTYQSALQKYAKIMKMLQTQMDVQVETVRAHHAQELASYDEEQKDPFYNTLDLHSRLEETQDSFILTAQLPDYEQQHLHASVQGDQLVLSGYRKNEEKQELSPGHLQSTASFQTFQETFPLHWPVEASKLSRETHPDRLIIRIPKKTRFGFAAPAATQASPSTLASNRFLRQPGPSS